MADEHARPCVKRGNTLFARVRIYSPGGAYRRYRSFQGGFTMISVFQLTAASLANLFDHTSCTDARRADFEQLWRKAANTGSNGGINPAPVALCKELLAGTPVHVGAAIGFPLGQTAWNPSCLKRSRPSVTAQTRSTTSSTSAPQRRQFCPDPGRDAPHRGCVPPGRRAFQSDLRKLLSHKGRDLHTSSGSPAKSGRISSKLPPVSARAAPRRRTLR